MHQLYRERASAQREECHEEFQTAQAVRDQLPAVCSACECDRVLLYPG